jgi:hypothetical protein
VLRAIVFALLLTGLCTGQATAWGFEGHQVIAAIARSYLTPAVRDRVDRMLAADPDALTNHDMAAEATWADRYRGAGHPETGNWHFVNIELDHPDLSAACFGFPSSGPMASQGPADDCIVDKLQAFTKELADPATAEVERLLALKYVLHFVGDVHQPLHAADNHDRGGNCVSVALGGPRTINLHSYWDTAVVEALGSDPAALAQKLAGTIAPGQARAWGQGDAKAWAQESYVVGRDVTYSLHSAPGCDRDRAPVSLPADYAAAAQTAAALQIQKAGIRLATVLNAALGSRP